MFWLPTDAHRVREHKAGPGEAAAGGQEEEGGEGPGPALAAGRKRVRRTPPRKEEVLSAGARRNRAGTGGSARAAGGGEDAREQATERGAEGPSAEPPATQEEPGESPDEESRNPRPPRRRVGQGGGRRGDTAPPSPAGPPHLQEGQLGMEGQSAGGCTAEARARRRKGGLQKAAGREEAEFADSEEEERARAEGAQLLPARRQDKERGEGAGGPPPSGPTWRRPLGPALTRQTGVRRAPTSEQAEAGTPRALSVGGEATAAGRGICYPPTGRPPGPAMARTIGGAEVEGRRAMEEEPSRDARTPGDGTQVSGRPPAAGDGHGSSRRR